LYISNCAKARLINKLKKKIFNGFKGTYQVLVLLEKQELTQDNVGLVITLGDESFAQDLSNAGQVRDGLVVHGLGHEVAVLL